MPNPIATATEPALCAMSDDISAEENDAQMSLSAAHAPALASSSQPAAPGGSLPPAASPSPAVSALVSRFTAPTGTHSPVEPSLGTALLNCKVATLAYAANSIGVVIAAPETFGMAFAVGAARIAASSAALLSCIDQNEAKQIEEGKSANLAADCRSEGGAPLTTADGFVVCAQ